LPGKRKKLLVLGTAVWQPVCFQKIKPGADLAGIIWASIDPGPQITVGSVHRGFLRYSARVKVRGVSDLGRRT
jgi:hypothetical protein